MPKDDVDWFKCRVDVLRWPCGTPCYLIGFGLGSSNNPRDSFNKPRDDFNKAKKASEREIRFHRAETHIYADEVVLYYLDGDSLDEAKAYMDTVGLVSHRMALIGTYISERNWDAADSSLVKLPLKTKNDTAIKDIFEIWVDLGRDTLTLKGMGSSDSTRVQEIATDTTLDASVIAKGMLGILLDTMYVQDPEAFVLPSSRIAQQEPEQEMNESPTEASYFRAYPNPFSNSTTIAYNLGKECEMGCQIRLYDPQGRIILRETLYTEDGKGSFVVDMSRYVNGIYYCSLYGDNQLLQTEKLILLR